MNRLWIVLDEAGLQILVNTTWKELGLEVKAMRRWKDLAFFWRCDWLLSLIERRIRKQANEDLGDLPSLLFYIIYHL